MRKLIFVLLLLAPVLLSFSQEKKFQIAIVGQFFSPNSADYQSIAVINQVNGADIGGNLSGYGVGKGGALNVNYLFYKQLGVSLDISILTFENKLEYDVTGVYYQFKNTSEVQTIKLGPVGRLRIGDTNFEVISSFGIDIVFADFLQHSEVDNIHENWDASFGTYIGPYIRIGGAYKLSELISIYADYEYSLVSANYTFTELGSGDKKYVHNSDLGGHSIRMGLAVNF